MTIDLDHALHLATSLALDAGVLLRREFHRPGGPRGYGGYAAINVEVEAYLRERLLEAFPHTNYVGEETPLIRRGDGLPTWYVAPNDGTAAFLKGHRGSALSIALVQDDRPVLGVVHAPVAPDDAGDLITWAQGGRMRRNGQEVHRRPLPATLGGDDVVAVSQDAALNPRVNATLCAPARFHCVPGIAYRGALVAVGEAEACVSLAGPVAWDYAAAHALVRGAGGDFVDETGSPVSYGPRGASRFVFGGHEAAIRALVSRPWEHAFERHELTPRPPPVPRLCPDPGRLARAQGCLLGQVAGDALGALVEFETAGSIARRYPNGVRQLVDGGPHRIIAGQPTDDSEMALALARTLVSSGFDTARIFEGYLEWGRSDPFDIGGTTRSALSGRRNHDSQANGALMRVSPLGIFGASRSDAEVARMARADAALTHPHAACGDASAVFAVAVAHAVRTGAPANDVYAHAVTWARNAKVEPAVLGALESARDTRPGDFMTHMGWVLIALQEAFFQLLHARSLEDGVVDTVMAGGDTDTNGAITAALLGAVYGRDALPLQWRRAVLTCRPLDGPRPRPRAFWPVDALVLAEQLLTS